MLLTGCLLLPAARQRWYCRRSGDGAIVAEAFGGMLGCLYVATMVKLVVLESKGQVQRRGSR